MSDVYVMRFGVNRVLKVTNLSWMQFWNLLHWSGTQWYKNY